VRCLKPEEGVSSHDSANSGGGYRDGKQEEEEEEEDADDEDDEDDDSDDDEDEDDDVDRSLASLVPNLSLLAKLVSAALALSMTCIA
jgi:hypothetical protein